MFNIINNFPRNEIWIKNVKIVSNITFFPKSQKISESQENVSYGPCKGDQILAKICFHVTLIIGNIILAYSLEIVIAKTNQEAVSLEVY